MPVLYLLPFLLLPAVSHASFERCFDASALRWNVPAKALRAIAKFESGGFHNIPDAHDHSGHKHMKTYGLMGLRDDDVFGHSLREAAQASNQDLEKVIQDPCANIDAAAALLGSELARNGRNIDEAVKRHWVKAQSTESFEELKSLMLGKELHLNVRVAGDVNPGMCWRFWTNCEPTPPAPPAPEDDVVQAPVGKGGEYPGADFQASPNFKRGSIRQLYIVLHTTEGNFNGAVSWLTSPKSGVSSHYIVRKSDGYVKQLVREGDRAFHARCWNSMAIGIEMEGFSKDPSSFTSALLRSTANLTRYLTRKYGIAPDQARVVGHNAGDQKNFRDTGLEKCNDHGDPGKYFDWSLFWRLLGRG